MAWHIDEFDADRLVLTHMGPTMLARVRDVEQATVWSWRSESVYTEAQAADETALA